MVSTGIPPTEFSAPTRASRKAMLGLGLGNTLEWYDWMIFGLLSAYIGPNFFPHSDPVAATLDALAIFGVGFALRPLGGVVLGMLADRVGRRMVMMLSVAIMALTTIVTAVTPSYAVIGLWAPLILLICRLLQGISTGVEAPLSTAYAIELSPAGREGRAAGTISMYVNLGILVASLVSFATSAIIGGTAMQAWGWRVPFIIGALLSLSILYLRRSLPETLHTEQDREESSGKVWGQIGRHWLSLLAIIFVVGAAQAFNYAWTTGLPSLAKSSFHEQSTTVFAISTLLGLLLLVGSPLVGRLADRWKLSRTFVVTRLLSIPAVFLVLLYGAPGVWNLAAVMLGGGVILVLNMTLYNVVSTSLLPKSARATGTGLGYGVAVALFGGTASYLLVWLQQLHLPWAFPLYTAVLGVLSVVFYLAARRSRGTYAGE